MESKKKIWVLTLRTNVSVDSILPVDEGKEANGFWAFSSFEKAKENMKSLIRAYANTPNKVFDGQGLCTDLEKYLAERREWDQFVNPQKDDGNEEFHRLLIDARGGYDDTADSFWKASKLPEILKSYLTNMESFSPDIIPKVTWTDYLIGCKLSPEEIFIKGVDDGPCNGIDPFFHINTFKMDDPEKDYHFRIRNAFFDDWDNIWSFIYIDLMSSEVDADFTFPLN